MNMLIPVQIFNYFKGYIVSDKIHKKSGVMGGNVALRLLDMDGVKKFYDGVNPMHINDSLLDHFTNAWLHIGCSDMMEIMKSKAGYKYPKNDNDVIVKSICHGDMIILDTIISMTGNIDMTKIDAIFRNSIILLGYYIRDKYLGIIPLNEINIGNYEDWCYLLDSDICMWYKN